MDDPISKDLNNIPKPAEINEADSVLQLAIDPVDGTFVQIVKKSDDKVLFYILIKYVIYMYFVFHELICIGYIKT